MGRADGFEHVLVLLAISFSVIIVAILVASAAADLYVKIRDRRRSKPPFR